MPPTSVIAGHGASIAYEALPVGSPGTFTVIAELASDFKRPKLTRATTETTPHNVNVSRFSVGYPVWGQLQFTCNYLYDNATQDHLTGIKSQLAHNTVLGIRMRGPTGTTNTDEMIVSGQWLSWEITDPNKAGAPRQIMFDFQPSGNWIEDGVLFTGT
jgi:hypothetical protein